MGYKQLDFKKRCQIYGLWRAVAIGMISKITWWYEHDI